MLAVFDNDGTICDTQEVEGACYARAIECVTGQSLATLDWTTYEEPTSSAIVRDLLRGNPLATILEDEIKREFVRLLEEERPKFPGDFSPIAGAIQFIKRLLKEEVCQVAIATGCFDTSARFKLQCCGLVMYDFPNATSSDTPRRRDIIPLAAARAGIEVSSVIYFGDAPWDARVSQILGVPMIGIGRRIDQLRSLGVPHVFRDYSDSDAIIGVLQQHKINAHALQRTAGQPLVPKAGGSRSSGKFAKQMKIRRYQTGEEEAIWEVYFRATHETNSRDYHPDLLHRWAPIDKNMDEWRKRLAEKKPFIAIIETTIAGMAELEGNGFINYFYVHPEFQNRGIGSALLKKIESEAIDIGLSNIVADVSITAKSFFERRGFSVTEARSNVILGHPAPNYSMSKQLKCEPTGSANLASLGG